MQDALAWFQELERQQERARLTRESRIDPVRVELLTQGLADLGISDPNRRLAIALAGYAREAIIHGLAIFRTKQELGTLPATAEPGRYLGGIIRQENTKLELERFSVHILEQRIRLGDLTLGPLKRAANQMRTDVSPAALPQSFVDRALDASYTVDFQFWSQAAAAALSTLPQARRISLYTYLCQRIGASFKTHRERRKELIAKLASVMVPP
jgi:hypothetical protein